MYIRKGLPYKSQWKDKGLKFTGVLISLNSDLYPLLYIMNSNRVVIYYVNAF